MRKNRLLTILLIIAVLGGGFLFAEPTIQKESISGSILRVWMGNIMGYEIGGYALIDLITSFAIILLANPGIKSNWWINIGTLNVFAAIMTGTDTNDPALITISGLNL